MLALYRAAGIGRGWAGPGRPLPELSIHYPVNNWQFGLSYLLQADAPGLVINHRYLALQLASDSLDWQQARTLVVNFALRLPL